MADQEDLVPRLQAHLQQVHDAPSTPLDQKLLDTASYIYGADLDPETAQRLILQIYQLLPTLQQDPSPVNRLLSKLLEPVPLSDILSFEPPVDIVAGLDLAAQPFNLLTLSLLEKADATSAQRLATSQPQVFVSLARLWLATEDEAVADTAGRVILHLLRVDKEVSETAGWDGAVWKRIFRDRDVYGQLYAICHLQSKEPILLSKSRKTIAQARLLDWLPAVGAMDWTSITQSYHPAIESSYGLNPGYEGLLDFASLHMVDFKSDVLMHRSLINFYKTLITTITGGYVRHSPNSSISLDFLTTRGLHSRTLAYYVQPDDPSHDSLDSKFLYGPAADYVASYVSIYPDDFMDNRELQQKVLDKISNATKLSITQWAHSQSPAEDLHVLSSLPRHLLVLAGHRSPHCELPSRVANPDVLNTLATLFHGTIADTETFPPQSEDAALHDSDDTEVHAAKELYDYYIMNNNRLWIDAVNHADTIALKNTALAGTNLIRAVITAPWNGIEAIMSPPAKSSVVPWLLSGPRTFSNLVGGHGDAESAAYKVAMAKFDCLRAFYERVKERREWRPVADAAKKRLEEGPWGRGAEVGGRIATLEM